MLSRLLEKVKSLLGVGGPAEADTGTDTETVAEQEQAYRCGVCGTAVADPDGTCPLCRSSDIVPEDEADQQGNGEATGGAKTTRSHDSPDDAVDRLRELREQQTDSDENS